MRRNIFLAGIVIMGLLIFSCTSGDKSKEDAKRDQTKAKNQASADGSIDLENFIGDDSTLAAVMRDMPNAVLDVDGLGQPIFYNMYLEVELSSLFDAAGAIFNQELLNSVSKVPDYLTSSQQAANLGVYAVDLSYARVFKQVQVASKYFHGMRKLAEALEIPLDYFENTIKRFEDNNENIDSLIALANEVYVTTDEYLKENRRNTTAAIIIMGGWIEAMHIALDVARESRDADIIERLVYQKASLSNLIKMLEVYKSHNAVAGYLPKLEEIKKVFANIDIKFEAGFNSNSAKGQKAIDLALQQLVPLDNEISAFRAELIQ
ncbi:MAG: hypothetical protein JW801_16680 [Bacteroidales bacterium]|nr:hypothetical protein [Bacteroidales bacterium]